MVKITKEISFGGKILSTDSIPLMVIEVLTIYLSFWVIFGRLFISMWLLSVSRELAWH